MNIYKTGLCDAAEAKVFDVKVQTYTGKDGQQREMKRLNIGISERTGKKDANGKDEYRSTFNGWIVYAGPLKAETLKGARILLDGVYVTTSTKEENGEKKYFTNFNVSNVRILQFAPKTDGQPATQAAPSQAAAQPATQAPAPGAEIGYDFSTDDLPFM